VPDPTAQPSLSTDEPRPSWLLGPADLSAIAADDALLGALARGEAPDPTDRLGWVLAAFVREVQDGDAR
jgi:hypothetical protein